jgi:hypothetical protein
MDDNQKREALKKVYPSAKWATKVDKMSSAQVTAVFLRLQAEKKL